MADVQSEAGAVAVEVLTSHGHQASFVHCDVTDFGSCAAAFQHALRWSPTKSIDVVALMAGVVGEHGSLVDQIVKARAEMAANGGDDDKQDPITTVPPPPQPRHAGLKVNLLGVYDCAYLALWYMGVDGSGSEGYRERQGVAAAAAQSGHEKEENRTSQQTKSLILISSIVAYADAPMFNEYQTSKCESSCCF